MSNSILIRLCRHTNLGKRLFLTRSSNRSASILSSPLRSCTLMNKNAILLSRFCSVKPTDTFNTEEIDFQYVTDGDPELANKLKILILETDLLRQSGHMVPNKIKDKWWKNLLEITTKIGRERYLTTLFKNEMSDENKMRKKEEKRKLKEEALKTRIEADPDKHQLTKNSMFHRIYDTTIGHVDNARLLYHSMFTQPLIIDCSYEHIMNKRECTLAAKQMMLFFGSNRIHKDPFDVHLCNIQPNSIVMDYFSRFIPTIHEPWFPINLHYKSYLDIFPKERLVYLTPDCRNDMDEYDHDAIYIIGCLVDKGATEPASMAKAKKEGIRMARFPLERYINWGTGSDKTLTLNHTVDILLDKRAGENWETALLKHIPRRKRADIQQEAELKRFRNARAEFYDRLINKENPPNANSSGEVFQNDVQEKYVHRNDINGYSDRKRVDVSRNYRWSTREEQMYNQKKNDVQKRYSLHGNNDEKLRYNKRQITDISGNLKQGVHEEMRNSEEHNVQKRYSTHEDIDRKLGRNERRTAGISENLKQRIIHKEEMRNPEENVREHENDNTKVRYIERQKAANISKTYKRIFREEEIYNRGENGTQEKYGVNENENRKIRETGRQNSDISGNFVQRRKKIQKSTLFDDDTKL